MSQGQAELNNAAWPTMKAEMRLEEFMARFEDPSARPDGASPGGAQDIRVAVWEMKEEQRAQLEAMNDLQRQIDLQRSATAELVGRSQSSAAVLEKFEEVAQSTAAAAEQLEAETILVRSCCDSTRQATAKEITAFRAELEESRNKHYADISALCSEFSGKGDAVPQRSRQAGDGIARPELTTIMEARDRNLRDQMTQALESAQQVLSRNFLEEHRKLLVEVLEERETRVHEGQQMRARLDALLVAIQKGADGKDNSHIQSMREAITQLRASLDEDGRATTVGSSLQGGSQSDGTETRPTEDGDQEGAKSGSRAATERFIFDSLATMRKDIASCLDAANAAVRLGEQLTNELNIEVDSRCSDIKALRDWVCQLYEVSPAPDAHLASTEDLGTSPSRMVSSALNLNFDDSSASQEKFRFPVHSPFSGARDLQQPASLKIAQLGQSMANLPRQQSSGWGVGHTLVTGSSTLPVGTAAADSLTGGLDREKLGLRLSGGNPLTRRQQSTTMPAGDRYLASQRLASSGVAPTTAAGSNGPANMGSSTGVSPRQTRVQSPIRNYLLPGSRPSVVSSQADLQSHQLRRQQSSPVRENLRDVLQPASFAAHQATLQAAAAAAAAGLGSFGAVGAGSPASAAVVPGLTLDSSRRMPSSATLARSVSPVTRRISAV